MCEISVRYIIGRMLYVKAMHVNLNLKKFETPLEVEYEAR